MYFKRIFENLEITMNRNGQNLVLRFLKPEKVKIVESMTLSKDCLIVLISDERAEDN